MKVTRKPEKSKEKNKSKIGKVQVNYLNRKWIIWTWCKWIIWTTQKRHQRTIDSCSRRTRS